MESKERRFGESIVERNFWEAKHRVSELKWQVLEHVFGNDSHQIGIRLLQREVTWIVRLETLAPKGLNESCNFSAFL